LACRLHKNGSEMSSENRFGPTRTLDCPKGMACDEDAFQYLLDLERARAGRSNHPVQLLFATIESAPGKPAAIPAPSAARLFQGMRKSLRETDVVGWYRQGRVAGAVLTARPDAQAPGMSGLIEQRVEDGLRQGLPAKVARGLRVRVVQLGPQRSWMS
jgi:hypothetical protein